MSVPSHSVALLHANLSTKGTRRLLVRCFRADRLIYEPQAHRPEEELRPSVHLTATVDRFDQETLLVPRVEHAPPTDSELANVLVARELLGSLQVRILGSGIQLRLNP